MRKIDLKKIFMTLIMLMSVSAVSAKDVIYERGTTNAWSDSDVSAWATIAEGATVSLTDDGIHFSAGNTGYENKLSLGFTANSIATLKTKWAVGNSTGRAGGYNFLRFGGVELRSYGQDQYAAISVDGGDATTIVTNKDDVRGGVWDVEITIDQATGDFTYSINFSTSGLKEGSGITSINPDGVNIGFFKPGRVANTDQTIKNIEVSEEKQSVETASYTINYETEDGIVFKSETRNGLVGNEVTVTDNDRAPIWKNGVKYIFSYDNAEGLVISSDGTTVVTIIFVEASKSAYSLTAVDNEGNELQLLQQGEVYEGESAFHYYSKALNIDGIWYMRAQNPTTPYYGITIPGGENATIAYEMSDITYFAEMEDLTPSRSWAANGAVTDRYSNGQARRLYSNSYVKTAPLPAGIYNLTIWARNQSSSQPGNLPIFLVDTEGNLASSPVTTAFEDWATAQNMEKTAEGIVVPEGYAIALNNNTAYNSNLELDYLYLLRTGDPEIASYVVKFVDEQGNMLKEETREGAVGVEVSLSATDKSPITITSVDEEENETSITYIYVSDDSEGKIIEAEGTVVTITFKVAESIPYAIKAVDAEGNELGTVAEGEIIETMSQVVYYTKAVKANEKWYAIAQNPTDPYYGITITAGENPTLTYEEADMDYFSEIENLRASHSWAADGAYPSRYANGQAKRLYKNSYVCTDPLPAGQYTVTLRARNNSRSEGTLSIYNANGNRVIGQLFGEFQSWAGAEQAEKSIEGVNIPEGYRVAIFNTNEENNSNLEMDYIYLKRTGDFEMLIGDVNGDGELSITDAALIVQYLLTGVEPDGFILSNAEVNGDNEISINDAAAIVSIVIGN